MELRAAVKAGDLEEVKKLIKEGADVTTPMPDHIIPEDDVQVKSLSVENLAAYHFQTELQLCKTLLHFFGKAS